MKNVFLLGFVSFLNDLSSEMIMPILPLFIAALGGRGMAVGLVGGVLVSGYLLFSVTALGFAFLQSLPAFILLFCAYGVVNAIVDANERAFIADLAPSHLKATALGTFHATIGVMSVIEGAVAGGLWQWISPQAAFIYGAAVTGCAAWIFILFGGFLARAK